MNLQWLWSRLRSGLPILLLIGVWFAVFQLQWFDAFLFPDPAKVFLELAGFWNSARVADIVSTLFKIGFSVLVGTLIGFGIGVLLYWFDWLYDSVSPVLDFFRSIPATALFPLFLLFFGIGDPTNIALAVWIGALYLSLHVSKGLRSTTDAAVTMGKALKKTKGQILYHIRVKEALPIIFVGLRTAVSLTIVVVVVTEMFVGTRFGIGKMLIDASYTYNIAQLYAGILLIGIIGYFLNSGIILLEQQIVHWHGK